MNQIFVALIVCSVIIAGFNGSMGLVTKASIDSAKSAVDLAISLIGQMTLWLGFMGVLREAGLMKGMARVLRPVMVRLFPGVPEDHPAMGAMIMNLAANMLGLGNAATPFGLKALRELDKLNANKGIASNAMALFMVINVSDVAILPLGGIAIRAANGSKDPAGIMAPSIMAMVVRVILAVIVCKLLERVPFFSTERALANDVKPAESEQKSATPETEPEAPKELPPAPSWRIVAAVLVGVTLVGAVIRTFVQRLATELPFDVTRSVLSDWLLPLLIVLIVSVGFLRGVKVYQAFIPAAKEGFQVAVTIIPFLVAVLVSIGMFRASGGMDFIAATIGPVTSAIGFPAEAVPMALIRPLSGNGAMGVMVDVFKTYGPDSFVGYMVSLINQSSETTFYVLALYFGSVGVRNMRHTLVACLVSDGIGLVIVTLLCHLFFGTAK